MEFNHLRLLTPSKMLVSSLVVATVALLSQCGKSSNDGGDDHRTDIDTTLAKIEVDAAIVSDQDGAIKVVVHAANPNTQVVKASAQSRIAGAGLAFAPGSFDIDFDVSLEEGRNIGTKSNLTKLGDSTFKLLGAAPAVVVTWTFDQNTFFPYTVTIPKPTLPALADETSVLAVIYIKNQPDSDDYLLGSIPAANLAIKGPFVSFPESAYGVYQAVYLNKAPKSEPQKTADKEQKIGKIVGTAPDAFAITGPAAEVSSTTSQVVWDLSTLADTYELKLDVKDPKCSTPYKTISGLTVAHYDLTDAQDGDNYACVTATNAYGSVVASNDGWKFAVDRSAPVVPAKPAGTANGISVVFTWPAVLDVGPAGLSHYVVKVGTTAGGSETFIGDVVDKTTKSVIGFDGVSYYAQVKAVDKIGNESDWSAISPAVVVHSN